MDNGDNMFQTLQNLISEAKRQVEAGDNVAAAKTLSNAAIELEGIELEWKGEQEHADILETT